MIYLSKYKKPKPKFKLNEINQFKQTPEEMLRDLKNKIKKQEQKLLRKENNLNKNKMQYNHIKR